MGNKGPSKPYAFILIFLSVFWFAGPLEAAGNPKLNQGKKWRIGYYEGGGFSDYAETMRTLVEELVLLGWIEDQNPPVLIGETVKPYWKWLNQCNSRFLTFKNEDCYSADWDENIRAQIRSDLLKKLKAGKLDLILAMGTWAGQDLSNNDHSVPTMVLSTSDPIKAGIIKSADNSGYDHVTARVDLSRYLRQLRMFHRIVGFKRLGVAYENTSDGRIYSAISEVQQVARERNFKVVLCEVIDSTSDTKKADRSCLDCYRQLARDADAVYVTALTCVDRLAVDISAVFKSAGTPSFSMVGSKFVGQGIMLSISSDSGYAGLGKYNAWKFTEILNGKKPHSLPQLFEDPLDIAVNRRTVDKIGFDMPESIISIATEIYD